MSDKKAVVVDEILRQIHQKFEAADLFYGHGTDNAWDEAVYLVYSVLDIDFMADERILQREVSADDAARVFVLADRRVKERIPVAYLVKEAWFAGLPFSVDERVLIPRSPLAELINAHFEPLIAEAPERVLDLCTGSGCIGIATALAFPEAQVVLADISEEALALARHNIVRHGVQSRTEAVQSDLFSAVSGRFDVILCNPPYVSDDEIEALPAEYRHEPVLGLRSDEDGLAIPLQILRQAADFLTDKGLLIMEVGYSHEALSERVPRVPFLWLDFDYGGEGVFVLTRQQLIDSASELR